MADKSIEKRGQSRPVLRASCDVIERDGEIVLKLEMPGVTREGLSVNIDGDQLEIRGTRNLTVPKDGEYLVREIRDADFHQFYTIDDTIDRNKINAVLKNGILTVTLGIKETQKPRKIQIAAS